MDLSELILETENALSNNAELPDPGLYQFYKNLSNRVYWIINDIDENTMDVVDRILSWNREDRGIPVDQRKPIFLYIRSGGGSLDVEESIVSVIRLSKTPIIGVAMGVVASAASLIYLACPKRLALPHASFIFHQGSCSGMGGNYAEIKAAMDDYEKQVEKMTKFYIENTNYSEDEVRTNIQHDWYIYMSEAVEKNIVDEVITDIDDIL